MEIVSEPDLTSADMAYEYLNALKDILIYGGVSDCDMEKGMVRCDVNVSVRPKGQEELGAKIEIKNMNSFSGVRKALEYEIPRQIEVLKEGGKLIQSTRRWDDAAGVTEEMRTKEHAHDYRYFPEPDLMPFQPTEAWLEEVKSRVVELPLARKQRFMRDYQLPASDAQAFVWNVRLGDYFEEEVRTIPAQIQGERRAKKIKVVANFIINNVQAEIGKRGEFPSSGLASEGAIDEVRPYPTHGLIVDLANLVENNTANSSTAQVVVSEMVRTGRSPAAIIQEKGLAQVTDAGTIEKFCDQAIAANPGPVADYKAGRAAALNFLKGQVMKLSKGKANPTLVGEILERKLKG
jgi:aspartyl-tRNA(Asn)/glutamyl-tRNA(Gln) amidotransferase subunit B